MLLFSFVCLTPSRVSAAVTAHSRAAGTVVWRKLCVWEAGPCVRFVVTLFRVSLGHTVLCK